MAAAILNVRDFGAIGDGKTLDTDAINRAIAAAEPGSMVVLPAGTYLSYSIRLRSNLTLHIDRGATLLAAGDPPPPPDAVEAMRTEDGILPGGGKGDSGSFYEGVDTFGKDDLPVGETLLHDGCACSCLTPLPVKSTGLKFASPTKVPGAPDYDPPEHNPHDKYQDHGHSHWHNALIWGEKLENVGVIGEGMIDGRGLTWNADPDRPTADKAISLKNCRNVRLTDLTIFRGGHFAVLATGCDGLTIANLRIDTNRDGIDIDSCRSVSITDCLVNAPNDDAIVLKSSYALGAARPTEEVTIRDCHVSGFDMGTLLDGTRRTTQRAALDGGGVTGRIKLGTESNGGFRKIVISDCTFTHCRGLALEAVDGGPMEDITVSNLIMRDITSAPLFIRLGNRARGPAGSPVSAVRRVSISHVDVSDAEPRFASVLTGIPGNSLEEIQLTDIQIRYRGGGGLRDAAARPPEKEDAYPEPSMFGIIPAYGLYCRHVRNLAVRHLALGFDKDDKRPAVVLEDVQKASFGKFTAQRHADAALVVMRNVSDVLLEEAGKMKRLRIAWLENGSV